MCYSLSTIFLQNILCSIAGPHTYAFRVNIEQFFLKDLLLNDFIRGVYLRCEGYGRDAIAYLDLESVDVDFESLKFKACSIQPFPQTLRRDTQCPTDANMKTRRHVDIS